MKPQLNEGEPMNEEPLAFYDAMFQWGKQDLMVVTTKTDASPDELAAAWRIIKEREAEEGR